MRYVVPGWWRRWWDRRAARRRYFAASDAASDAIAQLTKTADPSPAPVRRMFALWELAHCEREMAANQYGFRGGDQRDKDGFTPTASHDIAARLIGMVADTEAALWHDDDGPFCSYGLDPLPVSDEAEVLLAQLRDEPRALPRGVLVLALHDAVTDVVGIQAAEALAGLACAYFELAGLSRADATRRVWPHTPNPSMDEGGGRS